MTNVQELDNAALVAEFVRHAKAARLTQSSAATMIGVSQATTSEWWRGIVRDLQPEKRRVLESYVGSKLGGVGAKGRGDYGTGLAGEELSNLYLRIDRIEAADMPEWLRVLRMDALASAVRAEAMLQAERASLERAAAIRDAEVAAGERARTAGMEAEGASSRALAVSGGGTISRSAKVADKLTPAEIAEHGQLLPSDVPGSVGVGGSGHGSGDAPRNAGAKR